jgi:siroheme synthase
MPVAVVERASRIDQRVVRGQLEDLATFDVESPAVIVIGPVAALELGLARVVADLVTTS